MDTRKGVSKRLRFEIFKRDSFTCQYCGRKAPDVVLQVDHIDPVASGGANDLLNLIASCQECNAGKADRKLSDMTVVEKRQQQLVELQERKEQIEMMMEWQRELTKLNEFELEQLANYWEELINPFRLTESGARGLSKLIRKYSLSEVAEAMRIAVDQYIQYDDNGPIQASVEMAWKKVNGICSIKRSEQHRPYLKEIFYIRAILRNRFSNIDSTGSLGLLEEAVRIGFDIDELKDHACGVRTWTQWRIEIEDAIRNKQVMLPSAASSGSYGPSEGQTRVSDDNEADASLLGDLLSRRGLGWMVDEILNRIEAIDQEDIALKLWSDVLYWAITKLENPCEIAGTLATLYGIAYEDEIPHQSRMIAKFRAAKEEFGRVHDVLLDFDHWADRDVVRR